MAEPFLSLDARERAGILRTAAARHRRSPVILEKDIWVCWVLDALFSMPDAHPMAFKRAPFFGDVRVPPFGAHRVGKRLAGFRTARRNVEKALALLDKAPGPLVLLGRNADRADIPADRAAGHMARAVPRAAAAGAAAVGLPHLRWFSRSLPGRRSPRVAKWAWASSLERFSSSTSGMKDSAGWKAARELGHGNW